MATYVKFQCFVEDMGNGVHNLNADDIGLYLTNTAPNVASHAVKADLAGITEQYGYAAAVLGNTAFSQASGVGTLTGDSKTWTASGGAFGPFRYVVLYNDTATGDPLIAYWDYGSSLTVSDGEPFEATIGASILTVT